MSEKNYANQLFSSQNFSVEHNSFLYECKRKQEMQFEFFLHRVEKIIIFLVEKQIYNKIIFKIMILLSHWERWPYFLDK